jgi:hypothetical protein
MTQYSEANWKRAITTVREQLLQFADGNAGQLWVCARLIAQIIERYQDARADQELESFRRPLFDQGWRIVRCDEERHCPSCPRIPFLDA